MNLRTMRIVAGVLFLLCAQGNADAQASAQAQKKTQSKSKAVVRSPMPVQTVSLRVQPIFADGAYTALDAQFTFRGCKSGRTVVNLPANWGGETELYKAIRDLKIVRGGRMEAAEAAWQRVILHKPNATIELRYRLVDDAASASSRPKETGNDYRARFTKTHFHVLGNTVALQSECVPLSAPARFQIVGMPKGAAFASDLEHQAMGRKLTQLDLVESILVGGDFRVIDAGGGARLAIRGTWSTPDTVWRDKFNAIARAQRAYWRAGDEPFLVTVQQVAESEPGHISVGGTGRSDAFAFHATPNAPIDTIVKIMSHEMMHTWVPRAIGLLPRKDEPLSYWLSEGFTDWASWRVLVRGGIWAPEDFALAFNEAVKDYEGSPVKALPNQAILERFWAEQPVQRLPYLRGMLLATYWDGEVQRATKGAKRFDDVLFEMQRLAKIDEGSVHRSAPILIRDAMKNVAGLDIAKDVERFVDAGEAVAIDEQHFAPCGTFATLQRRTFHRGFDIEATLKSDNTIMGTVVGGPAYNAGLRDGMKLVGRRGGQLGDSRKEIGYEVLDQGEKKTFRYMPEGEGVESFRELAITSNLSTEEKAHCMQRLSGLR
jgi:predicted metalloprotease with PDZ domain